MWEKFTLVAAASLAAFSVHAVSDRYVEQTVELKDGTRVHIFKDGKMGMEDRLGRAFLMPEGQVMEARDGRTLVMNGNEVWRVRWRQLELYGP
ncbi:MAG TPA: CopK family periplasmic copper-binding protein [Rhodocyclaceae bacterium]|nr:CopK family periplasmic copper-binding protein [Rhodocyclaceae bacterium]